MEIIKQFLYRYPFLAYLLFAGAVFWPVSLGIYALQFDAIDVFLPWRFFGSESIRQGIVPLWNPYQSGGYPFFADMQYAIWNPELFIVSLFSRYNATTVQLLYVFYLVIGGLGFRYLLQQFKLENKISFFGGILFMFSGILIGHAQSIISILGAIWLPWAIGSYIAVLKSNFTFKTTVSFVLFLFLMLSSGYQAVSIMLFYLLLSFFIYRLVVLVKAKDLKSIQRFFLGHLVAVTAIGTLMAGVVFSLIDVFPYLSRLGGVSVEDTQRFIMHPKAFVSILFPLASVQESIPQMDISFQNIFNGTLVFFLLIFGVKNYRKYYSPYLIIMSVFGVIYGLACFGGLAPIQPFLANHLPGFNLFYYPVFYRYFTWIILLIVSCFGLQHFLEIKKPQYFLYYLFGILSVYVIASFFTLNNFGAIQIKDYTNWSATLRSLSFNEAVLFESLIHIGIITIFILAYFLAKQKAKLIFLFMVLELGLIAQLNIPITVHGEGKTATINNFIESKREGFYPPNNTVSMAKYETKGVGTGVWRNQGNFTNLPNLKGFTSFRLNARDSTIEHHPEVEREIESNPLAYLKREKTPVIIEQFSPQHFVFNVTTSSIDSLILQQANYPGWEVAVNGIQIDVSTANLFQLQVPLFKGVNRIEFQFKKPVISFLFYLTHLGFIALLLLYFWINYTPSSLAVKYLITALFVLFVSFRFVSFQFKTATTNQTRVVFDNQSEIILKSNLNKAQKEAIIEQTNTANTLSVAVINEGLDFDAELLSLVNYSYAKTEQPISVSSGRIDLSKAQKSENNEVITLNKENRFADPFFYKKLEEIYRTNNVFTCGLTIYSKDVAEGVFVVLEIKRGGKFIFYKAIPIEMYKANNTAYFMTGLILPTIEKEDKVSIYLWNNSSEEFAFSKFNVNILSMECV